MLLTKLYERSSFCLSLLKHIYFLNKKLPLETQLQKSNVATSGNSYVHPLSYLLNYNQICKEVVDAGNSLVAS